MSQTIDYQQSSFNAGELSPLVKGREGLEKYRSGLKTCENALVLAHGPVTSRGGFRYIGEIKDSDKAVRLIPFEFNEDQAYVLEMGDAYMRVWMDGGQVVTPDAETVLLLHMNGGDGDISFTDKSANAHTVSPAGNAQVDTVDPLFTTGDEPGNLLLDGAGDYLEITDHADFVYTTDPLTIDTWFYVDSLAGEFCVYYHVDVTNDDEWIALWVDPQTDEIYFAYSAGGVTGQVKFDYSAGFAIDTWYHLALIRGWDSNVNDWMVTINGIACGSAQTANMDLPDYDTDPHIGAAEDTFIPDHSHYNRK